MTAWLGCSSKPSILLFVCLFHFPWVSVCFFGGGSGGGGGGVVVTLQAGLNKRLSYYRWLSVSISVCKK